MERTERLILLEKLEQELKYIKYNELELYHLSELRREISLEIQKIKRN